MRGGDPPGCLDAVHNRHPDVHQDEMGTQPVRLLRGLLPVTPVGFLASLITLPWAIAAGRQSGAPSR
jgi:hypothetical protein